ncbi:helix-turn-helix domain-containing protein [Campylobacter ureolyticus]|uniref:helix-turn-helix domain-containing protein n=1 Tax=Campylobacter ureolyticus TaxID=827 RepID=UPI0026EDC4A2|nr:helix-turn-helix domain-containing protein [Campylobacter ureolyticus]
MYFLTTSTASKIFDVSSRALQISANRKSKKYPFIELNNTKKRGYGGKRLLFKVGALKIKEAISKNIISTDIKIWDEKLNLVSVDEILGGDYFKSDDGFVNSCDDDASNCHSMHNVSNTSSSDDLVNNIDVVRERVVGSCCDDLVSVTSNGVGYDGVNENRGDLINSKIKERVSNKFSHLKTLNEKQKLEVIAYSKKYSVKKASKFFGISDKNIYRWLKEFENGGIKEIKDRRGKRIKADLILIKQAILSIGNAHKSSWWMEYVRRFCLTNNLEFNAFNLEADISKSTFYRHANTLIKKDADIRNFLRGGLDGLTDMNLSVKRDYLMENEEWQIDATSFDFMCLNEKGEPQRYEAIGIVDAKSKKRVYELADSPNSYANVRLLKKAFIKMGRPGYIKGDNGKDYVGTHFQGVLARLGVSYIAAAPFKGYQKGVIEKSHGVMQNFFEGLPGFIGHNAGHRIKKENEALEKSKRLSGVKTNIKNLLTKDEMQSMIDSWCDKKYGFSKNVDRAWFDERLFGKAYQRVLSASGISINSITYQSLELYKHLKIGDSVEVIEDIDDASKVYVYHKGEFICEIVHSEVKNITAEEVKKAKKEYQKTHITPTKNYIKSLRDEKDAYYKEVAKQNLDEKMKAKNSVIKKESAAKKVEDEDSSSGEIYLPDINEVLKEFVG